MKAEQAAVSHVQPGCPVVHVAESVPLKAVQSWLPVHVQAEPWLVFSSQLVWSEYPLHWVLGVPPQAKAPEASTSMSPSASARVTLVV